VATKKRKPQAAGAKPTQAETRRAENAMRAAMADTLTRDLARHATEQCLRAVYGAHALADLQAGRILISLECAAAILLYEAARVKHAGQIDLPLAEVLNQITHEMLAMVSPDHIASGEKMLSEAAKTDG